MTFSVNKDVFRLQISIDNAMLVQMFETEYDFGSVRSDLLLSEAGSNSTLNSEVGKELTPRYVVHNKV